MHWEGLGPQVGLANSVATDQKLHCPGQHWELPRLQMAKGLNGRNLCDHSPQKKEDSVHCSGA